MKIGIITIFKANNYGAELQAFALQRKLDLLGYESELIDYPFYKHPSHRKSRCDKPLVSIGLPNRLKESVYPIWQRIRGLSERKQALTRQARMDAFHSANTRLSGTPFYSLEQLYAAEHPYDVYMAGSDQLWNPRMNCSLDPYFLTFAPSGKRRVSYASSFGVSRLPDACQPLFKERLSRFDAISVREKRGAELVRELTGKSAAHVLDPTLLLNAQEWSAVGQEPPLADNYVLVYELMESREAVGLARMAARELGLGTIVRIRGEAAGRRVPGVHDVADAGPAEFIGLFRRASFVVTNSFHGTAFSVNFRIPFLSVIPERMKNAGRIADVLDMLGLSDRKVAEGGGVAAIPGFQVDFTHASERLRVAQVASLAYLADALTGPPKGNG